MGETLSAKWRSIPSTLSDVVVGDGLDQRRILFERVGHGAADGVGGEAEQPMCRGVHVDDAVVGVTIPSDRVYSLQSDRIIRPNVTIPVRKYFSPSLGE